MPWPQTGATQYHAQVGLPGKGCTIKELVDCNDWDLEPFGPAKRSDPRLVLIYIMYVYL